MIAQHLQNARLACRTRIKQEDGNVKGCTAGQLRPKRFEIPLTEPPSGCQWATVLSAARCLCDLFYQKTRKQPHERLTGRKAAAFHWQWQVAAEARVPAESSVHCQEPGPERGRQILRLGVKLIAVASDWLACRLACRLACLLARSLARLQVRCRTARAPDLRRLHTQRVT